MKTRNIFKFGTGLVVMAIAAVNFVNAKGEENSFSIVKVNEAHALNCSSNDGECLITLDGIEYDLDGYEKN